MNDLVEGVRRYEPGSPAGVNDRAAKALGAAVRQAGEALGFARVGFAPVTRLGEGQARLETFRARGFAGEMDYLVSGARHDPGELLPEAKTVIVVALAYGEPGVVPLRRGRDAPVGEIARYARGQDYHQVLKKKLERLAESLAALVGRPVLARAAVDTAPLLERELARRAGIGFQGKSSMLIAPGLGSYVLLGELLVDVELESDRPRDRASFEGCGGCRACLDACPTQAFAEPYVLDARRCISYLTIEFQGVIPRELRAPIGTRVFGCDVCQETCPFNASSRVRPLAPELAARPALSGVDLLALLNLGSAAYRKLVRGTALRRASRTTLQRNAAIALGNSGDPRAVAPLAQALREHPREVVRTHAAWALGRLAPHLDGYGRAALEAAARSDDDRETREEARRVLSELGGTW